MSNCNHVNPAPDSLSESSSSNDAVDDALRSTYLWTALRRLHDEFNNKSRCGSQTILTPDTIVMANIVLNELHEFVGDFRNAKSLPKLDEAQPPTCAQALLIVGQYKATLRNYMVEMLGKNPYTLA